MRKQLLNSILFVLFLSPIVMFGQQVAPSNPNGPGSPGACGHSNTNTSTARSGPQTPQNGNGTLGNIYSQTKCGLDFTSASQRLGKRLPQPGVNQPAPFAIAGIPAGAIIEKAFFWAEGSGNGAAQSVTINGPLGLATYPMAVVGSGADKCWGYAGSYTYRADVTASVNGNGVYNVSGIMTNPPVAGNDMDGGTLLVIWSDATQTWKGTIYIADGAIVMIGGTTTYNMTYPAVCGTISGAKAFLGVGDIQFNPTSWSANSTPIPIGWNWWDFKQVNTTVVVGQTSSGFMVNSGGDCYNLCIAGLYYRFIPTITTTSTPTTCAGCNGTASVTVCPLVGPYTYSWAPSGGTASTATGLCAGTYTVTVSTACTTNTMAVVVPLIGVPITLSQTQTNVLCYGQCNGSATITATSGNAPFTFSWSPAVANSTVGATNTASGLCPGTYVVTGTDAGGCVGTQTVTITQPAAALSGTFTQVNLSCNAVANGSASITMSGGTGPYSFAWAPAATNSTVGNTNTATGLAATTYVVTATDANGCLATSTITITEPPALAIAPSQVDVLCNGVCSGTATVAASGGTPGYSYLWTPSSQTTPTATALCAGNYSCLVTDANGCTLTQTFLITEPPLLTLTSAGFNVTCFGVCDGQLVVIPAGGTPVYSFLWSTGCITPSCNTICAGTYNVTVTDQNGCVATATATVTEPSAVVVNATTVDAHCGLADGSATSIFSGGTGALTPVWYNPPSPGTNLTGVVAGNYFVVVTDANGCDDTANVTINNIAGVTATAGTITPVSCFGGNNGSASVNIVGGTGIITYAWNCSPSTTNTASNLVAGPCTVLVTDSAGCTSTVNVTINEPTQLTISATSTPTAICVGQNTTITGTGGGGTPAYSYQWLPGSLAGAVQSVSPIATQVYTVVITDANGCIDSTTTSVTVNPNPVAILSGDVLSGCAPLCMNFSDLSTLLSGIINQWSWDFGDGSPFGTQQNPAHCYVFSGVYNVSLTVTTTTGCAATVTMPNYIQVFGNPVADFSASPQPTTELTPEIFFTDLSSANVNSWGWAFGDINDGTSTLQNPSFDYDGPGCFDVVLTVSTINGCVDSTIHQICIDPDVTLFVPNAFTPNGDGTNDLFFPQGVGLDPDNFEMWIFDRWGNLIFYTDDLAKGWNGSVNGNSDLCQQDTYVWKIKARDLMGGKHNVIGHVSLIR